MDVGVEGDNTLLVVYARRLMLFWLTFEEQSDTSKENGGSWWAIRLNWSERKGDAWTPRRAAAEALSLEDAHYGPTMYVHSGFSMYAEVEDDRLTLSIGQRGHANRTAQLVLDPCTWDFEGEAEDAEVIDSGLPPDCLTLYQGYHGYGGTNEELHAKLTSLVLPVSGSPGEAPSASVTVLASTENGWQISVCRDDGDFDFTSPFFVTLDGRPWLVTPETTTSTVAGLAGVADGIGLGDLLAFSSLGEDDDPASGTGPDDDVEYAWSGGARTTIARSELSGQLSRSTSFKGSPLASGRTPQFSFAPFHHPYVCRFLKEVRLGGIFALLNPSELGDASDLARQQLTEFEDDEDVTTNFEETYDPVAAVVPGPYPHDEIDFSSEGAYAHYNWELFLHLPWLVSARLRADQRYEEALDWLHCIFDPRSQNDDWDVPERYWKLKPFLEPVDADPSDWEAFTGADGDTAQAESFERQVAEWQSDPFNPHLLARLRAGTYPKAIFMAYLDTLIGWGDHLFEQDTRESLQEATQIYVVARHLLGDRPVTLPRDEKPTPSTYTSLRAELALASSSLVTMENLLPAPGGAAVPVRTLRGLRLGAASLPSISLYTGFCVPPNPKLLGYWDTVEDRLFKIRNGLNLAGERRSLDLFAPPIDPGALVAARAGGQTLQSALAASAASLPNHRFVVLHGRATAMAGSVRALGGALLSALEKKDAEALSLLRQGHELRLLEAVQAVREHQVEETEAQIEALEQSKANVEARRDYYQGLIDDGLNGWEITQIALTGVSGLTLIKSSATDELAAAIRLIPEVAAGLAARAETGGNKLAEAIQSHAGVLNTIGAAAGIAAGMAATQASYARRSEEWTQQVAQADLEVKQLDAQIAAAELRKEIATRELANHKLQREQSAEVERWLKSKYTSQSLYQWLTNATASLYFSAYKLAVDLARQAERCYQHELGVQSSSFIQYGHWDSLRKGLLAGERLAADLERLDAAYLAQDAREYELTKHVSLARLDPFALASFVETGSCSFSLPEAIFDLDCPGHYFRRISNVSVSLSCLSGPQVGVHVSLSLGSSALRCKAQTGDSEELLRPETSGGTTTLVTSTGREDPGLFQLNPGDPRYLPFERRGVVNSAWTLSLCNPDWPGVDLDTLSDVVLHLRYTAREGGTTFAGTVRTGLQSALNELELASAEDPGLAHVVSAKRDESDAFAVLLEPEADTDSAVYTLTIRKRDLPVAIAQSGKTVTLSTLYACVLGASSTDWADGASLDFTVSVGAPAGGDPTLTMTRDGTSAPMGSATLDEALSEEITLILTLSDTLPTPSPALCALNAEDKARLDGDKLDDLLIILVYTLS